MARARILAGDDEGERAIQLLQPSAWLHPELAALHRELAILYKDDGQLCKATASARQAVEAGPEDWRNWDELGAVSLGRRDEPAAEHAYRRASELAPAGQHRSRYNLLALLYLAGRADEMIAAAREVPRELRTFEVESNLAAAEQLNGDLDAAAATALRALDLAGDHRSKRALALLNLGQIRTVQGYREAGRRCYRQALDLIAAVDAERGPSDARRLSVAYLHALLGECYTALFRADEIEAEIIERASKHRYLARIASLCEEDPERRRQRTIAEVRRAVELGASGRLLRREPELAWLAADPDFRAATLEVSSPLPCP